MTYWKIQLTYRGASPAGTDLKHRAVVEADRADIAIKALMRRLQLPVGPVVKEFQTFDASEVSNPEAATAWFVETGDFRPKWLAEQVAAAS